MEKITSNAPPKDQYTELHLEILVSPNSADNEKNGDRIQLDSKREDLTADLEGPSCFLYSAIYQFREVLARHWRPMKIAFGAVLLVAYLGYFGYSMYYSFGDEPSIRLLVGTVIGLVIVFKRFIKCPQAYGLRHCLDKKTKRGFIIRKVIQWSLYLLSVGGAVAVIVLDVVMKRPRNLICLVGIALLLLVCCLLSRQPEKINWHAVFWGMGLQFWFAVLIGKTTFGSSAFEWLADRTEEFMKYADTGSKNVFGQTYLDHRIVFQVMPTTIFFNAFISVLYYMGVIQVIFAEFGRFLSFCIGTSPVESVSAASNLFLSLVETPILIKPFVDDITKSELFAILTGGFASIAGSLLYAFAAYGAPVKHILTASVMSAPAALAFAKLLYPDDRKPTIKASDAYTVDVGQQHSLLGALVSGARDGMKVAILVVLNLMIFTSCLEFLDQTVLWFAERAGVDFTLSRLMAYVFYPFTYMMGFDPKDCFKAAYLLGLKILTLTLISFIELGKMITNEEALQDYITTYNGTWSHVGDDVYLEATNTTLVGGIISAVYVVCGLSNLASNGIAVSNLASIGIALGAYCAVAPKRTSDIFKQVSYAFIAGNLASFSTACMAVGGAVTIVALDVAPKRPQNLICLGGIAVLLLLCCVFSKHPEKINWHAVFWGMALQFWSAVLIRKTQFGRSAFEWLAERSLEFLRYADEGSVVVFGPTYRDHRFVFQVMPSVIFFNAVISVLYYLGVVQVIFAKFGKFLSICLGTSPIESVSTASNLLLSQVETPILVKPFAKDMTKSELFAIMTGGYASIAGSLLWAFAAYGAPINHILTASVMSAPAALAFAKLIYPDERKPTIKAEDAYNVKGGQYGSLLSALSTGARDGLKMASVVVVSLLVYTAALQFLDSTVLWFAERAGVEGFTLSKLVAYIFYPLTYVMGFELQDCFKAARLLGVKILTFSMVSFRQLGIMIQNLQVLQDYMATTNGTWSYVGDDIFLHDTNTTLVGGVMTERSSILATYMMCGLSNLGSIGITVGAFLTVAPSRAKDIFKQASLACLAGNVACFSTACVAGLIYTD
ncbi:hypothetical protein ACOMHN_034372 [Nucella lapillus]